MTLCYDYVTVSITISTLIIFNTNNVLLMVVTLYHYKILCSNVFIIHDI